MKHIFYIGILFLGCLLTTCKTHRVNKGAENYSYAWDAGLQGVRFSGYSVTDSLIRQWQRQLTGRILVWSPPDSTGKQYIQAEIDLRSDENSQTGQHSQVTASDTTHVATQVEHTGAGESYHHQETLHDSRPFSQTTLFVFCGLAVMAWFLYRKKKNESMG